MVERLSGHFIARWRERVGGEPTVALVRRIVRESVKVCHTKDLYNRNGDPKRQLATYWHPELGIVLRIDHIAGAAVSVLTATCRTRHPKGGRKRCDG